MMQPSSVLNNATISKYRLIAVLGHGGMADVYLAQVGGGIQGFTKLAVVKTLRPNLNEDPDFVSMFLDEARLAARLNHQNVVSTFEVGEDRGRHFISMEYLEGQSLSAIRNAMRKKGGVPIELSLYVIHEVLAALQYAHELADFDGTPLRIVHRDVTPQNIFLTYSGQAKLVDFGIAKAMNASVETRAGVIKGKVMYMAPEQARSAPDIDGRADVFSVGVVMWEALTGRRFWKGKQELEVLHTLVKAEELQSPREFAPDIPELLETICMRALSPSREHRYACAADFQADLELAMTELGYKMGAREAGAFLVQNFEAERNSIRSAVEEHIASAKNVPIGLANLAGGVQGEGSHSSLNDTMRFPQSGMTPAGAVASAVQISPLQQNHRGMLFGSVGALAAAIAAIGFLVARGNGGNGQRTQGNDNVAPSANISQQGNAQPPQQDARIRIAIAASPATAKLILDDQALPSNPYMASVKRDGSAHVLKIEAKGYDTKTMNLVFENDITANLALEKKEVTWTPPPVALREPKKDKKEEVVVQAPTQAPQQPPAPSDLGGATMSGAKKGTHVKLDEGDPWKK